MSVDNPAATNQLVPGKDDYWVAFYPGGLGRDGVISAAHSPSPSLEGSEAILETSGT